MVIIQFLESVSSCPSCIMLVCQQCFDAFAAVLVAQDNVPLLENGSGRVAVVFTWRFVGQETVKLPL